MFIINHQNKIVNQVYFEEEADNRWLLVIETEYAFSSDYYTEHFEAEINCDLSTDENWGIENLTPVFVISDGEQYVASGNDNDDSVMLERGEVLDSIHLILNLVLI